MNDMTTLVNMFKATAVEKGVSFDTLANMLVEEASTSTELHIDNFELSSILRNLIRRRSGDDRIDTFVAQFSSLGFELLSGIGALRVKEMNKIMEDCNLSWGIELPDVITADTKLDTLGISPAFVEKLAALGVESVGSFLRHPRIADADKTKLRLLMD